MVPVRWPLAGADSRRLQRPGVVGTPPGRSQTSRGRRGIRGSATIIFARSVGTLPTTTASTGTRFHRADEQLTMKAFDSITGRVAVFVLVHVIALGLMLTLSISG